MHHLTQARLSRMYLNLDSAVSAQSPTASSRATAMAIPKNKEHISNTPHSRLPRVGHRQEPPESFSGPRERRSRGCCEPPSTTATTPSESVGATGMPWFKRTTTRFPQMPTEAIVTPKDNRIRGYAQTSQRQ